VPRVRGDSQGYLQLPEEFLRRRHMDTAVDFWLDYREGELVLLPCVPDLRKLYLEPTTRCNLRCRICPRIPSLGLWVASRRFPP
jgi:hypothetical protein